MAVLIWPVPVEKRTEARAAGMVQRLWQQCFSYQVFSSSYFVPSNRVTEAFQELMGSLDHETDELLSNFLSSFEATLIGVPLNVFVDAVLCSPSLHRM